MTYFFSQSFPSIRPKLKRLERGPLAPRAEVLVLTFKVYHGRDEKACKQKYQTLAKDIQLASLPGLPYPQGLEDHWVPASNVVRRVNAPKLVLIPAGHLGHVQSATKRDISQLTAPMHLMAWGHQTQSTLQLTF